MKSIQCSLHNFLLESLFLCIISFSTLIPAYAQDGSYSTEAQKILDNYSADNLNVFKFSINNILNSDGDIVEKPAGNPSIFGRTDYGSEFFLENELSTAFSIEIPAFVINDLALDSLGEYFPIIIDGAEELSIDFKDFYDTENGEAVTPEMGFVKIIDDATSSDLDNLSDGEIVEFFVRPTDEYLNQHNEDNLFFIDRAIPENPVVTELGSDEKEYEASSSSDEGQTTIILKPGEEAVTMANGEVKIYVTSIYVPAPASNFEPTQIVMPVLADGDYNYEIEPATAKSFPEDLDVVAIPEEEAEVLLEKVKAIKKEKEARYYLKHDEESPPPLDPETETVLILKKLIANTQNGRGKLLLETRKKIQMEFPNMPDELVTLIIDKTNSDDKFDLIKDPKEFLNNQILKVSNPQDLNFILNTDLSQRQLAEIYNLILYKFTSDLANLGFEALENQKFKFSTDIIDTNQIREQVELQNDIIAITTLLGSNSGNQDLSDFLIEPDQLNSNSSNALFESSESQKVLDRIKRFSDVISSISSSSTLTTEGGQFLNENIPLVEVNVGVGESIVEAMEEKLSEYKRINRNFQPRSQNSKLEKFDFDILPQEKFFTPTSSPPLLMEVPNIPDQELQLVAETTEATNNILDETITRMLGELGDITENKSSTEMVSATNDEARLSQENRGIREDFIFSNALSSAERLQEIEDIRATFQILGIGS